MAIILPVKTVFRFVLLGSGMLVIAMVSAVMTMRFAIHGHEVAVPGTVGKTPADGQKLAETAGLQMAIERRYYSLSVPRAGALSQLPAAGTKVRRGWESARVAESLGPQRVEIPSVLGQSEHAAEITIRRRGLDLGSTGPDSDTRDAR